MDKSLSIVAIVLALGALGFTLVGGKVADAPSFGANAGPDSYFHSTFFEGLTRGGINATSTDDTTATFLQRNLLSVSRIEFTPNVASITATLPATSTLSSFIPKAGMTVDVLVCNATTTASTPFTLAFGTGMIDSLATSTLAIETGDCAQVTFSRKSNTDIDVFYDLGY